MSRVIKLRRNLKNRTFGRLKVLWLTDRRYKDGSLVWHCQCKCGATKDVGSANLLHGRTRSCGCLRTELIIKRSLTHGLYGTREYGLWHAARGRARDQKIEFTLKPSDIHIPEICPLLQVPLEKGTTGICRPNAPSLDRVIPGLGYTKENTWVISFRANTMKQNASLAELETLLAGLRKKVHGES
jgi:hypothetical protein